MNIKRQTGQGLAQQLQGRLRPPLIKGRDHLATETQDLTIGHHRFGNRRPQITTGQINDSIDPRKSLDQLLTGHHDAGARPRQPQLRQAQHHHGIVIPERPSLGKNNIGEGGTVGAIDNQRNIVGPGQGVQPSQLLV